MPDLKSAQSAELADDVCMPIWGQYRLPLLNRIFTFFRSDWPRNSFSILPYILNRHSNRDSTKRARQLLWISELIVLSLRSEEVCVGSLQLHEGLMGALFNDCSLTHDIDVVGELDG